MRKSSMDVQKVGAFFQPPAIRSAAGRRTKVFTLPKSDVQRFKKATNEEAAFQVIEDLFRKATKYYGDEMAAKKRVFQLLAFAMERNEQGVHEAWEDTERRLGYINQYVIQKMPTEIWLLICKKITVR